MNTSMNSYRDAVVVASQRSLMPRGPMHAQMRRQVAFVTAAITAMLASEGLLPRVHS